MENAFGECDALTSVTCRVLKPFQMKNPVFSGVKFENCTLYVPRDKKELYKTTEGWNSFLLIEEIWRRVWKNWLKSKYPAISSLDNEYYISSSTFKSGNFYDMMCVLIHEQDHYNNYNPYTYNEYASEFFAFNATIYNQYFEYASPEFRESIYSQYHYYESLYYSLYY